MFIYFPSLIIRQQLDELHHIIEQHKNSEQAIDSNIIPDSIESYGKLQYDLTGSINKVGIHFTIFL